MYAPDTINPYVYRAYVSQEYIDAIELAGAVPVMVPVLNNLEDVAEQISGLDAILLTGGYDIDPNLYGQTPSFELGKVMRDVDDFYMAAIKSALDLNMPIFGICKGLQAINVYFGGSLYQDLKSQNPHCHQHSQTYDRHVASHSISCQEGSFVHTYLGDTAQVNSHHHQAICALGQGLNVSAVAEDGVIEAIEAIDDNTCIVAVQWHPEMMACAHNASMQKLLGGFVELANSRK